MDNDRGLIVGHDSWGKGLVQTVFPLVDEHGRGHHDGQVPDPERPGHPAGLQPHRGLPHGQAGPDESREIKYTLKGRKVLGQGGISPDYEVPMLPQAPDVRAHGPRRLLRLRPEVHPAPDGALREVRLPRRQEGRPSRPGRIVIGRRVRREPRGPGGLQGLRPRGRDRLRRRAVQGGRRRRSGGSSSGKSPRPSGASRRASGPTGRPIPSSPRPWRSCPRPPKFVE